MTQIDNGRVRVEIDEERGRLLRVAHRGLGIELVGEHRLAENFRLLLPLRDRRGHYVFGRDQPLGELRVDGDGRGATLIWASLRSPEGTFAVRVSLRIRLEGDDVTFGLSLENGSSVPVEEAAFPVIGGMGVEEGADQWRLHHPTRGGAGREWEVYREFPGTYLGPAEPVWSSQYPDHMVMPWVDLYRRGGGGVMLANLDPRPGGATSIAFAQLFPCTNWRGDRQLWPERRRTGGVPVGMALGWACFPFLAPGERWESPPVVLHFHEGTWWAAAAHFRTWFDRTMPIPVDKSKSWLAGEDAWQSTIISYPEGSIGHRFADLPSLARAARRAGINVLQIDGWDQGGIDRDYPIYEPDPRLGTADELRAAIRACAELGVKVLLFANLQWAHVETGWWKEELHRYAVRDPYGHPRNSMGWEYHTLLGLANQCEPRMVQMNPAHPEFDRAIREQLLHVVQLGAQGTQIDKLVGGGGIDYTPGLDGPRDEALVGNVWRSLHDFLEEARGSRADFCAAAESHWDRIIPFVDASYARHFTTDHLPTVAAAFPEYRQTCCVVGHYDYGLVNNSLRHGHVINVEARCLHGSADDAPELAAYVREVLLLRRGLRDVLWDGGVVEPRGLHIADDGEVLSSLRRNQKTGRSAVILNHFAHTAQRARISVAELTSGEVRLHEPGRPVRTVAPSVDLVLEPDQVAVLEWSDR